MKYWDAGSSPSVSNPASFSCCASARSMSSGFPVVAVIDGELMTYHSIEKLTIRTSHAPIFRYGHLTILRDRRLLCGNPYSQNIRTRFPTRGYASTTGCASACLPLDSPPYSASRGTGQAEGEAMDWKHLLIV